MDWDASWNFVQNVKCRVKVRSRCQSHLFHPIGFGDGTSNNCEPKLYWSASEGKKKVPHKWRAYAKLLSASQGQDKVKQVYHMKISHIIRMTHVLLVIRDVVFDSDIWPKVKSRPGNNRWNFWSLKFFLTWLPRGTFHDRSTIFFYLCTTAFLFRRNLYNFLLCPEVDPFIVRSVRSTVPEI